MHQASDLVAGSFLCNGKFQEGAGRDSFGTLNESLAREGGLPGKCLFWTRQIFLPHPVSEISPSYVAPPRDSIISKGIHILLFLPCPPPPDLG